MAAAALDPNTPHIVMTGDPASGFDFIGPFDTFELAAHYAEGYRETPFWIAPLMAPEDD